MEHVDQGALWLSQIWDLEQLDELRPTANHLGASMVFASPNLTGEICEIRQNAIVRFACGISQISPNLTGFKVPNSTKDAYRKAISTADRRHVFY